MAHLNLDAGLAGLHGATLGKHLPPRLGKHVVDEILAGDGLALKALVRQGGRHVRVLYRLGWHTAHNGGLHLRLGRGSHYRARERLRHQRGIEGHQRVGYCLPAIQEALHHIVEGAQAAVGLGAAHFLAAVVAGRVAYVLHPAHVVAQVVVVVDKGIGLGHVQHVIERSVHIGSHTAHVQHVAHEPLQRLARIARALLGQRGLERLGLVAIGVQLLEAWYVLGKITYIVEVFHRSYV